MNKTKTDVVISFDIEFDINNAFTPPYQHKPRGKESIYCVNDNRDIGLGYILDTLNKYDLKATFFVETCNTSYFGSSSMGDVAQDIFKQGHDVQLHIHPAWEIFQKNDWHDFVAQHSPSSDSHDNLGQLDQTMQTQLIKKGLSLFSEWQLPRPIALRAGNLFSSSITYQAMRENDLPIASNIGMGIHVPKEEKLHLYSGIHKFDDILEVPVTSFCDVVFLGCVHKKLATLIGMSFAEMKQLLHKCHDKAVSPAVFLSHVSEFIQPDSQYESGSKSNQTVCQRFERLCQFLSDNRDTYNTTTISSAYETWKSLPINGKNELISTSILLALMRGLSS